MPSVMTLEGVGLRGLYGNAVSDFILRQGIVVGGLMSLGLSFAVGGVLSFAAVKGLEAVGAIKPGRGVSGALVRRRVRRRRRRPRR